jgi:hypothetical protein
MLFDYIDRQIIVSLFPLIKEDWQLTDTQLGSLVSIILGGRCFGCDTDWDFL